MARLTRTHRRRDPVGPPKGDVLPATDARHGRDPSPWLIRLRPLRKSPKIRQRQAGSGTHSVESLASCAQPGRVDFIDARCFRVEWPDSLSEPSHLGYGNLAQAEFQGDERTRPGASRPVLSGLVSRGTGPIAPDSMSPSRVTAVSRPPRRVGSLTSRGATGCEPRRASEPVPLPAPVQLPLAQSSRGW